ncbi:MAG TPA: POTRA domain-containing protein, partial [Candidatus Obscuribacterales bacterium]
MRVIFLQCLWQQLLWQPRAIATKVPILGLVVTTLAVASQMSSNSAWASSVSTAPAPAGVNNLVAQTLPTVPANPQADPNQDRFLQPQPTVPTPAPTQEEEQPILPTPTPETPAAQPDVTIPVKDIEVMGSTIFGPRELDPIVQPYEGRSLTLEQLRTVADAITQLYLNQGYITSRAVLVDQTITDGIVRIRVIEGSLEQIEVEGNRRVNTSYIRDRIRLGAKTPLKKDDLEDQLRLLKIDPLFKNVEASLRAGDQLGQSILTVRVSEADPFDFYLNADNYSPPSVGSERLGISAVHRNLTGLGDQLAGAYYVSTTGGAELYDFSYRVPINAMNGTIQLRAAPNDYKITDPEFSAFGIRGSSELYEIIYRQPLVRSPREELALSLGFTFQDGQTFLFNSIPNPFVIGTGPNGVSRTSVIKFGQDYVKR